MTGGSDIVILGALIGISVLAILVVLPLLIIQCSGFRGCLQCGSELHNGAGQCLMCGQILRTPRVVFQAWMHRVCQLEEPARSEPAGLVQEGEKRSKVCGF
jgi:hypothetical protein